MTGRGVLPLDLERSGRDYGVEVLVLVWLVWKGGGGGWTRRFGWLRNV